MDRSFKFGAGRYLQEQGLLERAGVEIGRFGRKPCVVGGPTAMGVVWERPRAGLEAEGLDAVMVVHPGQCCHEEAREIVAKARAEGCDLIVGVGGGRAMDFAKLCAHYLGTRVVNIPTCCSTCAPYAPFSLVYTPEGQTIPGNFCYPEEVVAILVDLDVMATQPPRCAASGILDAMAKAVEMTNGSPTLTHALELPQDAAYAMGCFTHARLEALARTACADMAAGRLTRAVEDVVYLTIPVTGMISGLSRGVGQSAIAHELYYQARMHFVSQVVGRALHGEIVGVGLIVQLHYNQLDDRIPSYQALLRDLGAPACLSDLGLPPSDAAVDQLYDGMCQSAFVPDDPACRARLLEGLRLIQR